MKLKIKGERDKQLSYAFSYNPENHHHAINL